MFDRGEGKGATYSFVALLNVNPRRFGCTVYLSHSLALVLILPTQSLSPPKAMDSNILRTIRTLVRLVLGLEFRRRDASRRVELRASLADW